MKTRLTLISNDDQGLTFEDDQGFRLILPRRYFEQIPSPGQSINLDFNQSAGAAEILKTIFKSDDQTSTT